MPGPALRRPIPALLVAAAVALPGCSRPDPDQAALSKAAALTDALTGSGRQAVPADELRRKQYEALAQTVQPLAGSATAGPAASMYLAIAKAGVADLDAARAVDLEAEALRRSQSIRSSLETWLRQSRRAEVREQFNPAAQIAQIEQATAAIREATAKTTQRKAAADAAVADLLAKSDALLKEAAPLRAQATAGREQAASATASAGLPVLEQAVAVQRRADALEVQAADLKAQAAAARPAAEQAQRELDRLAREAESLRIARAGIARQVEQGQKDAAQARQLASAAATRIAEELKALEEFRAGDLARAADAASKGYQDAANAARKAAAGKGDASSAKLAAAKATQSLGDVQFVLARGLETQRNLLRALAGATPALPDHAGLVSRQGEIDAQLKTALDNARTTYADARTGLEGSGAKGDAVKARLDAAVASLNAMLSQPADNAAAPEVSAAPAGEPAAAPAGDAAPAADTSASVAAVEALLRDADAAIKAGDTAKLASFYRLESPDEQAFFDASAAASSAQAGLDAATQDKFGKSLREIAANNPMAQQLLTPGLDPALFAIDPDGPDRVKLTFKGTPLQWAASARDGEWKFDGIVPKSSPLPPALMTKLSAALAGVYAKLAEDVRAGSIANPEDLLSQLATRAGTAMQQAMSGKGPGG